MISESLVSRDCPSCGHDKAKPIRSIGDHFTGDTYQVGKCSQCGLQYLIEAPSVHHIGAHYENYAGSNMQTRPLALFAALRDIAFQLEYGKLSESLKGDDRVLELGTGDGALASYFHRKGKNITACDVFDESAWSLKEIPYVRADINNISPEVLSGVKAVVMRHVLEHVHYPADLMKLFAKSGVEYVHILVPNVGSPFMEWFDEDWCSWDPPRHLQFFESQTLDGLASLAGYRLENVSDHGIDEYIVSLFRRHMLQWHRSGKHQEADAQDQWWFKLYQPKGLVCTLSAAGTSMFFKSVLSRLYRLEKE